MEDTHVFNVSLEKQMICPVCETYTPPIEDDKVLVNIMKQDYGQIKMPYCLCGICGAYWQVNRLADSFVDEYYREHYDIVTGRQESENSVLIETQRSAEQINLVFPYLKKDEHLNSIAVLDFGSSRGKYLMMVREAIQKNLQKESVCMGVETSIYPQDSIMDEYGSEIFRSVGKLITKFPENYFDVLNMSHSLEHLNHPRKVFSELIALVRVGGYVTIEVPNYYGDPNALLFHHPIAFNDSALRYFTNSFNLKPITMKKYDWFGSPVQKNLLFLLRKE